MLHTRIDASFVSDWSLLQAGEEVILAVPRSSGRAPSQLTGIHPQVTWRRADGEIEQIHFGAEDEDEVKPLVVRELLTRGLLMVEVDESGSVCGAPWVLSRGRKGAHEPC